MRKSISMLATVILFSALGAAPSLAQGTLDPGSTEAPPASSPPAATTPAPARSAAPAPSVEPAPTGGIKATGFFLEVGLGGQLSVYNGLTGMNQQIGGSFLLGYKLSRLILGLGLELMHMGTYSSQTAPGFKDKDHTIINAMIFEPTVQYHLLESAPLALFLTAGIHVGFAVYDETGTTTDDDTDTTLFGFHFGMGIRYFLHPRFCMGIEAGFRGLWVMVNDNPSGPGEGNDTTAAGAFYGRIGFAAVW